MGLAKRGARLNKGGSLKDSRSHFSAEHRSSNSHGYDRRVRGKRSMREGDGDHDGIISQTHMQNVLNLNERESPR